MENTREIEFTKVSEVRYEASALVEADGMEYEVVVERDPENADRWYVLVDGQAQDEASSAEEAMKLARMGW